MHQLLTKSRGTNLKYASAQDGGRAARDVQHHAMGLYRGARDLLIRHQITMNRSC
jgi:hypothetical protein